MNYDFNFIKFNFLKKIKNKLIKTQNKRYQLTQKYDGHLKRLDFYKNKGINFLNVFDIGVFEGNWSRMFKKIFPNANILMIEANLEKEQKLKNIGNYRICLLGSEDGKQVKFFKCQKHGKEMGNTVFQENSSLNFTYEERLTTKLDTLLLGKDSFDLIKMDIQGSELDCIKGGERIINNSKYLLLELQTANYNLNAPYSSEVISYLKQINFELMDIFELIYKNGYLVQVDFLFRQKNLVSESKIFS
jgi:FkbM family methyltransferase